MSNTSRLNARYGSFFLNCAEFAVSPYTVPFLAIAEPDNHDAHRTERFVAAAVITAALTFVVPILPAIASVTFNIAAFLIIMAAASAIIAYPIAMISDALSENHHNHSYSNFSKAF